ncbi:MAG: HDIG domain-containing protein [Deltaproteobacteria bacterium]|nr:HDIG domain-containing protein [Deltaproteobacteria bacterium]
MMCRAIAAEMTLSRNEATGLMVEYGRGAAWTKHCFAVADAAASVGSVLGCCRVIDQGFLWSAALLHDIGRYVTHDPIRHGLAGYDLLTRLGYGQEAHVCASHILFGLEACEAARFGLPARDFVPRTVEERLVPLVDFLIENDTPTTLDRRFASLRERNADNDFFLSRLDRARERAETFMRQLNEEIGEPIEAIVALQGRRF